MIRLEDVHFSYPGRPVLHGIDLTVKRGQYLGIMGGNGSGKTTLARLMNGLLQPTQGTVKVNGLVTSDNSICRSVGMVFQDPDAQAIGETVEEDMVFGLENLGLSISEIDQRIDQYLGLLGIRGLRYRNIDTLSWGQKQLVNLAAVMAMEPECLILDEPVSMVDPENRRKILEHILDVNRRCTAVVHISHDPAELVHGDSIIILDGGRIKYRGMPLEVFSQISRLEYLPAAFAISKQLGLPPVLDAGELVEIIWRLRSGT